MSAATDTHVGRGAVQPLDTDERIEITIFEAEGRIVRAEYAATGDAATGRCAETVCRVIAEHGVTELFQMNNNAVYYNAEPALALEELYKASVAVLAAKRAAADWCRKNGLALPEQDGCCGCLTEE